MMLYRSCIVVVLAVAWFHILCGQTDESRRILLTVTSEPSGAEVYLGTDGLGSTPLSASVTLRDGATLVVKRFGFTRYAQSLSLPDGDTVRVHAMLGFPSGQLTVFAQPRRATIILDERQFYRGVAEKVELPLGRHSVTVIDSSSGRSHALTVNLEDSSPITASIRMDAREIYRLGWAALAPGLPQYMDGSIVKGTLITGAVVGSWINVLAAFDRHREADQVYAEAQYFYEYANTSTVAAIWRKKSLDAFDRLEDANTSRNVALALLGGAYLLSIADTYLHHMEVTIAEVRGSNRASMNVHELRLAMRIPM